MKVCKEGLVKDEYRYFYMLYINANLESYGGILGGCDDLSIKLKKVELISVCLIHTWTLDAMNIHP